MSEGVGDNGNGRVTMAILGQKVDEVLRRLDSIDHKLDDQDDRLCNVENLSARNEERIKNLQTRDTSGTIAGIVTGIVAGVIALFKP